MAAIITTLVGPARSGKTVRLLDRYRNMLRCQAAEGRCGKGLWIGPSQRCIAELRELLVCDSGSAFLAPGLFTFAGFAESVVAASARQIRPISRLQKRLLLSRVIRQGLVRNELPYFSSVARTAGFVAQLDEWIAECKRQDTWADDFRHVAESRREQELAQLYGEYQKLLVGSELYDAEGRFWAAREILEEESGRSRYEYELVVVDGFSDFTSAQLDILKTLAVRSAEMLISLTADQDAIEPPDPATGRALMFARVRRTIETLREILPQLELKFVSLDDLGKASLRNAERTLFQETLTAVEPLEGKTDGLKIVAANGMHGEIEEVARRIKTLLLEGRAQPQDCRVVVPNLSAMAHRVAEVFENHGLPYWIETRPRLTNSPLVRVTMSLLRLKIEDWPFRLLLEITGNRLLTFFDEPHGSKPRVVLERIIRAAQFPLGRDRLLEHLDRRSAQVSEEGQSQQPTIALAILTRFSECLNALPERATLAGWAGHLTELLTRLGAISGEIASPDWDALIKTLHSLDLADTWLPGDLEELDAREFVDQLEAIADDQRLPALHDDVGRVRVLTTESARHGTAPHVFLVGLSEEAFSSSEPFVGVGPEDLTDDALVGQGDKMRLFYSLITRATESLTLSYPALDDKGQQLPPSPFLTELESNFLPARIPVTTQPLGAVVDSADQPLSQSAHRQAAVLRALEKDPAWLAGIVSQPSLAVTGLLDAIGCIASRADRDRFGTYEGLLSSEAARAALARRFDDNHLWSPSQLEGYATCPFRFFAEQLLSLKPLSELTLANDAGRRGSLLHQVLVAIYQELDNRAAVAGEEKAWQAELAERFRCALEAEVTVKPLAGLEQSLREIERRQIEAWAPQYAQQEIDYRDRWGGLDEPLRAEYFEVRFGPQTTSSMSYPEQDLSTPVPFELNLGSERIRITGQIDRIDVGRIGNVTVFNIIDYKSGREVRLKDEAMQAGRQLQLPLYALAAEELLLVDKQAEALAAGYWSIQGRGFEKGALQLRRAEGHTLSRSEQWRQLRPQILATVEQLVLGIRKGKFPVHNEDQNCTRWCPQNMICRVAHIRSLEKPWPPESPQEAPQS